MSAVTQVTITEEVTDLTVSNTNAITVDITAENTEISVNNFAIPVNFMDSVNVSFPGHNTVTADNVRDAIKQLADQQLEEQPLPQMVLQTWRKEIFFTIQTIIK